MLPDSAVATFLAVCLTIFVAVNLLNMAKHAGNKKSASYKAEVEQPTGLPLFLVALGTGLFFLESVLYTILVFGGLGTAMSNSVFQLRFPLDSGVQLIGTIETAFGYALFLWSVLARGKYATSWEMPENQKLVTWGPYRYVRHPSYLAYFILFIGLFLTLLNLIAAVPLVAIPGYVRVAVKEEELLTKRFGEAYTEYQRATGMFFPRKKPHG